MPATNTAGTQTQAPSRFAEGLLTVEEARTFLRMSRARLYELLAAGTLPSVTLGRRRLIARSDVLALLERLAAEQK